MRTLLPAARIKSPFVFLSSGEANPPPLMRLFMREVSARASGKAAKKKGV
jgi:hypothetical protein